MRFEVKGDNSFALRDRFSVEWFADALGRRAIGEYEVQEVGEGYVEAIERSVTYGPKSMEAD